MSPVTWQEELRTLLTENPGGDERALNAIRDLHIVMTNHSQCLVAVIMGRDVSDKKLMRRFGAVKVRNGIEEFCPLVTHVFDLRDEDARKYNWDSIVAEIIAWQEETKTNA